MIEIIAAIQKSRDPAKNRGIGFGPDLLYRIKADMAHFVEVTNGHTVIMGRKTFDSIPTKFKPLSNRRNVVITRNETWNYPGVEVYHDAQTALLALGNNHKKVFVIGGGEIYKVALPLATRLHLTIIDGDKPADSFFPRYESMFPEIESSETHRDEATGLTYTFETSRRAAD